MKILIVDDYATTRRTIRNLLTQIGYTDVEEVEDGVAALQVLDTIRFGLIIADWTMEPMSGLQLLKAVRVHPEQANIPFIMVTADSKTENVLAAKQAGVSNYIVKPFNADTLKQKIGSVLGSG